jgi:2-polyprenyl-3-methyl-5-hydroxy-6-metoxy-1,4-benzoquinol methylase
MFEPDAYQYFEDVNWGLLRLWGERSGRDVLDVGCGFATTSQYIQQRANRVVGVESSGDAAAVAGQRIQQVLHADLTKVDDVRGAVGSRRFDAIIFADVLEHLPWPLGVLRAYLELLKDDGSVFVSLPNVGLWSVRLAHLFGSFEYQETGVLDQTHLRFFTRKSALRLLDAAGLVPERRTYNPGLVRPFVPLAKKLLVRRRGGGAVDPDALLNSRPYKLYLKTAYPIERAVARLWPGALAFQMIFEARRKR